MSVIRLQIIKNVAWAYVNVLIRYATSFVVVLVLAKMYSPAEFGQYQLALTYFTIFDSITLLHGSYIRNLLIEDPSKEGSFITSWVAQSIIIWFSSVIFCVYGYLTGDNQTFWILMALVSLRLLFKSYEFVTVIVDSRLRNDLVQGTQIISTVTFNLARAAVAALNLKIVWVYAGSVLQGMTIVGCQIYLKRKLKLVFKYDFVWRDIVGFIKGSFWLSLTAFLAVIQLRIATVLLESRMDSFLFGNYQLLFKLIEPGLTISLIVLGANYTVLVHTFQNTPKAFAVRFWKVASLSIAISLFASLFFIFVPVDFLVYFLGERYRDAFMNLPHGSILLLSNTALGIGTTYDFLKRRYVGVSVQFLAAFILNVGLIVWWPNGFDIQNVLTITSLSAFLPVVIRFAPNLTMALARRMLR